MKPVVRAKRAEPREQSDVRIEAVKKLRALRRRMNLRITQAEIRRALTRGQV
jgi:hypothetical protein